MSAPLSESAASAQDPSADQSDTAQTVRDSVMAEQVSHNVVNVPESASGSTSLVDVVANHDSAPSAESGNNLTTQAEINNTAEPQPSPAIDISSLKGNADGLGNAAAEPSAGDAAAKSDSLHVIAAPAGVDEKKKLEQGSPLLAGVNNTASLGSAIEDGGSQDVSAVNSDTEASKGDSTELKDGHLHVRTNSVKKPTTFSKVSVTKNFLAKSASPVPAVAKPGEKASPVNQAAQPAAKPRLIAKTGASIRELQKARQNAESPSGPDASKVWNKNRPAPPPTPKQFTDEELKQQYGIHMATRLQSDENGKESKWADIDEDEDDWVPEAVTWIDGTKSALTPADNVPTPKEAKLAETAPAKPTEGVKPNLTALKKEPSGPPKTILKPGAAAHAKQNGLAASSPGSEKATLKAKSPAPPAKSPWATLPPVDKSSPINLPTQPPGVHAPFASQDARAYESSIPSSQPAREIAADTFDRHWREGEGTSRELFNSVNGRFESAPEGRRSSRPEPYGRKPSVLLRPSGGDHPEPSPAFQTRSGSQTDGAPAWAARRRGSSVSQSGMPPRRMSINRGPEPYALQDRRQSVTAGGDVRVQPNGVKVDAQPNKFSQSDAWSQQMPPPPPPGTGEGVEDPVKVQERIMKEKRELARKRRQEEEQEAEVARKERLKAKMAALEGAGQSRQERQAAKEAAAVAPKPDADQTTERKMSVETGENKQTQVMKPELAAAGAPAPEMQAPPSHNSFAGTDNAKVPAPDKIDLPSPIAKPEGAGLATRSISEQMQRQGPRAPLSPKASNRAPFPQATSSPYRAPNSAFSSPGDRKQQPFGRPNVVGNGDGFSPWPSAGSGNVWGTAGIGNGVFESASAFAPMPMTHQQNSSLPPPPGMTRPDTATRISPQALGSDPRPQNLQQTNMADQARAFAPPGMEGRPDHFMSQPRPNGASPSPGMGRQQRVPGPIAPPSRSQQPQQTHATEDGRLNAWQSAAQTMPAQYASAAKAPQEDGPTLPRDDTFKETFKATSRGGRLGGPRKYEKTEYTVHDAQGSRTVSNLPPAPPNTQTQPAVPVPTASPLSHPWKQTAGNTVRLPNGSMNPAHGGAPVQQLPIGHPKGRPQPAPVGTPRRVNAPVEPLPPTVDSREQPPPPPETATHPVYSGNAKHPHVRLPRSKPVVKLPPQDASSPSAQQSVVMPPRQHWGPPGAMRPLVQNEAWQARFNGLFNRANITTETPPSPPKTPPKMQGSSPGVTSSSKIAMPEAANVTGATVSLPYAQRPIRNTTAEGFLIDNGKDVTSKDTIEQMFNEELSFGSKPLTRIPRNAAYPEMGFAPKHDLLDLRSDGFPKLTEAQSKAQFEILQVHYRNAKGCFVKMPGVKTKHNPIFWKRGQGKGINKAKAKAPVPKVHGAQSPVSAAPHGGSNAGSRKPSTQKVSTVSNASTPQQKSPAPIAADNAAPVAGKRFKAPRGRGQNAPVKPGPA